MERKFEKIQLEAESGGHDDEFDLDNLLHPAHAFEHPSQVVRDPDLTLNEKRAILASWASDACAIKPVRFDEVIEALRTLDKQAHQGGDSAARYRRVLRRGRIRSKRSDSAEGNTGHGQTLN